MKKYVCLIIFLLIINTVYAQSATLGDAAQSPIPSETELLAQDYSPESAFGYGIYKRPSDSESRIRITRISNYKDRGMDIKIPPTINNIPVGSISIDKTGISGESFARTIVIPESVALVQSLEFIIGLEHIIVHPDNEKYTSLDGALYSKDMTYLISVPSAKKGSFTMPISVKSIYPGAFTRGITSIEIPAGLEEIINYDIGSSIIKEIKVSADNKYFSDIDGVLFNKNKTTLIRFPAIKSGEYIIPNSVTKIADNAFRECKITSSVTIPNSVTVIGKGAFSGCSVLKSLTIPAKVTTIEDFTFSKCSLLSSVEIPNSVTAIGKYAFYRCDALKLITLPAKVKKIGESAFAYCKRLTSINIPNGVTVIEESSFSNCSKLTNVVIPNSVTAIGKSAFDDCEALTSITIPAKVATIGESAFRSCKELTSVNIPNSVTVIGETAFGWCPKLANVIIPNSVTSIGKYTFCGCKALTEIIIPVKVTKIEVNAFSDTGINKVVFTSSGVDLYDNPFPGKFLNYTYREGGAGTYILQKNSEWVKQ